LNILVVRTDKPKNRIIACISPINKALAKSCNFIDEVIVDEVDSSVLSLSEKFRRANIDASITLFSNTRVAFAQFIAQIPKRIAPATKIAQIFYTHRVKQRRSEVKMAEFEYNLSLTQRLFSNIDLEYKKPLIEFDDAQKVYDVFCVNNEIEKKVVAFHVGFGGSSDANWNLDEYETLIRRVLEQKKYQVVLTFGPDEKELYEEMQKRLLGEDVVFYLSLDGIVYFAKLISKFKLFVSTSTGTYHLASLVGCPTMTFFADTLFASAARWRSVGDEKIQQHFMLPSEIDKRKEIFLKVQKKLGSL